MSAQANHAAGSQSRTRSNRGKYLLMAVVALVLVAMALDTKVVPIADTLTDVFSPEAYGKKDFPRIQALIEKSAVDARELTAAIAVDKAAAGEKYGKPGSVGPIFPVKFTGVVGEGASGVFKVAVEGMPEGVGIRVQTGPAINGTEVRDATGGVDVALNSVAGEAMRATLKLVRPFGRFVELGKRDFLENTRVGLRPFVRNISYFGVDLDQLLVHSHDVATAIISGD